nr:hypothetical protein [uncultured Dyadobacter sp.]
MLEKYSYVEISTDFTTFEFDSVGPKGKIRKIVIYTRFEFENHFNLGFGDKNSDTGEFDDLIVTDNGDSVKILATVASTLLAFTDKYPAARVIITGSTQARTRLYRISIASNLSMIINHFTVLGLYKNTWLTFEKDVLYDAFLVYRNL